MEIRREWALPFCLTAWLLAMHAPAADDLTRRRNFDLLYNPPITRLAPPSPRFDPDQQRQQFVLSGVLVDVRTTIVNGRGLRRQTVQGSARNTGTVTFPRAVLELLAAPVAARTASGQLVPGNFEVVASQPLGDLGPGRAVAIALSLTRPDVHLRLYQIRLLSR